MLMIKCSNKCLFFGNNFCSILSFSIVFFVLWIIMLYSLVFLLTTFLHFHQTSGNIREEKKGISLIKIVGNQSEWNYLLLKISRLHRELKEMRQYLMNCYHSMDSTIFRREKDFEIWSNDCQWDTGRLYLAFTKICWIFAY